MGFSPSRFARGTRMASSDDKEDGFDPEIDLLHRYEQMVQTQVTTLEGIDDKAASVFKLVAALSGLVLSGITWAVSTDQVALSGATLPLFIFLGGSVVAFFSSLIYAIITYLSSKFSYGPTAGLGNFMADYEVEDQSYRNILLRGYSDAIQNNRRVVNKNARRFQLSLASLLVGILCLVGAGTVVALPDIERLGWGVLVLFGLGTGRVVLYITREEYLTLDRE